MSGRKARSERGGGRSRTPERGYRRLFINLGKDDGFYPGEVMQFINQHVKVGSRWDISTCWEKYLISKCQKRTPTR
ncbi:MAG: hypothetical protein ACLTGI_08325 [Hoylesella buccalis]